MVWSTRADRRVRELDEGMCVMCSGREHAHHTRWKNQRCASRPSNRRTQRPWRRATGRWRWDAYINRGLARTQARPRRRARRFAASTGSCARVAGHADGWISLWWGIRPLAGKAQAPSPMDSREPAMDSKRASMNSCHQLASCVMMTNDVHISHRQPFARAPTCRQRPQRPRAVRPHRAPCADSRWSCVHCLTSYLEPLHRSPSEVRAT